MARFISRRVVLNGGAGLPARVEGGVWEKKYPALVEFMSLQEWEPGQPRLTGTLNLFIEDGQWKACVSDRDQGLIAFVSAANPEELLVALEKGLQATTLDWRRKQPYGKGGKK